MKLSSFQLQASMVIFLLALMVSPLLTPELFAQTTPEFITKVTARLDEVQKWMTGPLGRSLFGLIVIGCGVLSYLTEIPKKRLAVAALVAMLIQGSTELIQWIWPATTGS